MPTAREVKSLTLQMPFLTTCHKAKNNDDMGSFICKQPNGLYCRFSTVVDTVTDYNMTTEDYIEMCAERAREEARDVLQNRCRPFEQIKEHFIPTNMSKSEFRRIMDEMQRPIKR